jgi:hypothetical protein
VSGTHPLIGGEVPASMPPGVRLDEKTAASCALTTWGDRLYVAWTGSDGALNVLVADSTGYSAPVTFKQRSPLSPTAAAAPDGDLVLGWTGTDRHVNLLTVGGSARARRNAWKPRPAPRPRCAARAAISCWPGLAATPAGTSPACADGRRLARCRLAGRSKRKREAVGGHDALPSMRGWTGSRAAPAWPAGHPRPAVANRRVGRVTLSPDDSAVGLLGPSTRTEGHGGRLGADGDAEGPTLVGEPPQGEPVGGPLVGQRRVEVDAVAVPAETAPPVQERLQEAALAGEEGGRPLPGPC